MCIRDRLRRVLIPALAFLQPFLHSSFQKYNIVVFFRIFRVSNDDPILEKARAAHIVCCNYILLESNVSGVADQGVESIRSRADTQDYRHSVHLSLDAVFGIFVPFDKPLHDRGVGTGFPLALGTAVRFIDNKVQSVRFVLNGIIKGFPNRVLPVIRVLRQFTVSADFLSIQKVDMTILDVYKRQVDAQ